LVFREMPHVCLCMIVDSWRNIRTASWAWLRWFKSTAKLTEPPITDVKDDKMSVDDDLQPAAPSLTQSFEDSVSDMALSLLVDRCMLEIDNYRHGASSNDRYCLELLRRTTIQRDALAWEILQQRFSEILLRWMHCHPKRELACRYDSEANYVAQAFDRFWQAITCLKQVEFATHAAALHCLCMSLNGAILDTLRAYARLREMPLPDSAEDEDQFVEIDAHLHSSWEVIKSLLPEMRERRLAYLLFHCGLKPREIVLFCPQEWSSVSEIYSLLNSIMERFLIYFKSDSLTNSATKKTNN